MAVFLAILGVIVYGTAAPRQSAWLLAALSAVVVVLAWLRRRASPAPPVE